LADAGRKSAQISGNFRISDYRSFGLVAVASEKLTIIRHDQIITAHAQSGHGCLNLRCPMRSSRRLLGPMDDSEETYNPWSIVNLVFRHLADEGLHPVLGEAGDPGAPAAALLTALGIIPSTDGNKKVNRRVSDELARLREAFEADDPS
jgi:hypothetical protein